MKPIPWRDLAGAVKQARTNPAARALLAEHVAAFVREGQDRALPSGGNFADRLHALRLRHWPPHLPVPVSDAPVPQSHHDTERDE